MRPVPLHIALIVLLAASVWGSGPAVGTVRAARAAGAEEPPRAPYDADITELVAIPGGEFTMGYRGSEEMPPHAVRVSAFLMDRTEVTNAQYAEFCADTGRELPVFWGLDRFRCGPGFPDHPVVGVSQAQAAAYAAWAGKRLPTEAEWEYAARGGLEGLRFDLADTIGPDQANFEASGNDGPVPVGSYRPNAYGLHDMVGNVREWTADRWGVWRGDPREVVLDPDGPLEGIRYVVKGGGWYSGAACNAVHVRNALPRHWQDFNVGFRCARDAEPEGTP